VKNNEAENLTAPNMLVENISFNITHNDTGLQVGTNRVYAVCVCACVCLCTCVFVYVCVLVCACVCISVYVY